MDEKPLKQAVRYIMKSEQILIVAHEKIDGDALGSGLALRSVLRKMGKGADFLTLDEIPDQLSFLPKVDEISREIPVGNDLVISVDCSDIDVDKLKYNRIGDRLNILISPRKGVLSKEKVSFRKGQSKYDLIVAVDCGDIKQIGTLYNENLDLFYNTVLLNIDHHISNDHFGKINVVEPTATSSAEIVLSLIDAIQAQYKDSKLLDADIATCLLTGITVDTNSFQNQNTSPKAFSVSAQLLAAGARQQEIVNNIYKTHHLSTLKLWGKALSNIKFDRQARTVWTVLSQSDFSSVNATEDEIHGLIDELITSAPGAEIAILLREEKNGFFKGSIRTMTNAVDANEVAGFFKGGGHRRAAGFKVESDSIEKVENYVIKKIYDYQAERISGGESSSGELIEDEVLRIPEDNMTRDFVEKVRAASKHSEKEENDDVKTKTKDDQERDYSYSVKNKQREDELMTVEKLEEALRHDKKEELTKKIEVDKKEKEDKVEDKKPIIIDRGKEMSVDKEKKVESKVDDEINKEVDKEKETGDKAEEEKNETLDNKTVETKEDEIEDKKSIEEEKVEDKNQEVEDSDEEEKLPSAEDILSAEEDNRPFDPNNLQIDRKNIAKKTNEKDDDSADKDEEVITGQISIERKSVEIASGDDDDRMEGGDEIIKGKAGIDRSGQKAELNTEKAPVKEYEPSENKEDNSLPEKELPKTDDSSNTDVKSENTSAAIEPEKTPDSNTKSEEFIPGNPTGNVDPGIKDSAIESSDPAFKPEVSASDNNAEQNSIDKNIKESADSSDESSMPPPPPIPRPVEAPNSESSKDLNQLNTSSESEQNNGLSGGGMTPGINLKLK